MYKFALISLAAAFALSACGSRDSASTASAVTSGGAPIATPAPATPVTGPHISGRIEVTDLTSLPAGLQLYLKLLDVSDPSVVPPIVAESLITAPRILPYNFQLGFERGRIDPSKRYVVEAALQTDGVVLYGTPAPTPVLTQGAGERDLVLNLVRGGKAVATIAPTDQLKNDFRALEAGLGGLRRITGERLDEQVAIGWDAFVDSSGQVRMAREQVDYGDAGNVAFRFAYQGGQPWVVERIQGGVTTLLGWTSDGQLILNEKSGGPASDAEITQLKQRALDLYAQAAARR